MKQLKKDLKVVNKGLKSLVRKIESIEKKIAKIEKASTKKRKVKIKARGTKRAVTKKISIPATVFGVMKRSKKSFDADMLTKKTGLKKQQVNDALFKLRKRGMVKSVGRGVYVKK